MNIIKSSTTLRKHPRHLWSHNCGKTYTRNELNQLKEVQQGVKVCSQCKVTFDFEAQLELESKTKKIKGKGLDEETKAKLEKNKPHTCEECGGWTEGDSCHCNCIRADRPLTEEGKTTLLVQLTNLEILDEARKRNIAKLKNEPMAPEVKRIISNTTRQLNDRIKSNSHDILEGFSEEFAETGFKELYKKWLKEVNGKEELIVVEEMFINLLKLERKIGNAWGLLPVLEYKVERLKEKGLKSKDKRHNRLMTVFKNRKDR